MCPRVDNTKTQGHRRVLQQPVATYANLKSLSEPALRRFATRPTLDDHIVPRRSTLIKAQSIFREVRVVNAAS